MIIAVSMLNPEAQDWWCKELSRLMPEDTIVPRDGIENPESVDYALVWRPATGWIASLPNLRAVISCAAGVDHIFADSALPADMPVIRTIGDDLTQRMKEYVLLHVLRHHRRMPDICAAQRNREWNQIVTPVASERTVAILGLGNLGAAAAGAVAGVGFRTLGWSRSLKRIGGVECHAGEEGLRAVIGAADIVVNLLPLTDETRGLIDASFLAAMKPGASFINAGRGGHVIEADLLAALDAGQLSHATLDVFETEPLPDDSPFWSHPSVTVTPHIASMIDPMTGARIVARNIREHRDTGRSPFEVSAERGY